MFVIKKALSFKYYWFWNAENLFLSFFIFSFIPCTNQKIGLNPKMYLAFVLFSQSRALGFTFKFKIFEISFLSFNLFRSLIHTDHLGIFSVKLLVVRVRNIDRDMFYVHLSAWEKTARLRHYDLKKVQIKAFYSFFPSFIRSSLYPWLALQLVLFS